ncbi:hypothetical protein O181_090975 [Austropuccinia psidii MF-1]|uniref:Uncharacterized protein n=1 Tax=Austropuccinia psidii MF-1 TaxID=1389203 RepID=A0A9Q3IWU3_9BASI|nr:hypothetical protein [Austropuccinia psidii MF-1]
MEIDRKKNFRFFECAPESGTPDSEETESEGTETPILWIGSSELHNQFSSAVMKTYSKHKHRPSGLQHKPELYHMKITLTGRKRVVTLVPWGSSEDKSSNYPPHSQGLP